MKILLCSSTYMQMTHGPAIFTRLVLHHYNDDSKSTVRLLCRDVGRIESDNIYRLKGWYPRGVGIFWEYFDNIKHLRAIKKLSRQWQPDLIIFVDAVLGYATSLSMKNKIPVIGLVNDYEYIRNTCSNMSLSKEWLVKWKSRILEKKAAKNLTFVIANSNFLKKQIEENYKIDSEKIERLYKGIDIQKYKFIHKRYIDITKDIKILFVKSDYLRGGFYQLIEALQLLTNLNFELYVCGPDIIEQAKIRKKIHPSVNLRIKFENRASQDRVRFLLQFCDIFCVPSYREALGVANIEALASGIPVVSTNVGGIPEVLDNGACGWLVPPGNSQELSNAIYNCVHNVEERQRKVNNGRKFVEKNFTHEKMLCNLKTIINKNT